MFKYINKYSPWVVEMFLLVQGRISAFQLLEKKSFMILVTSCC